MLVHCLELSDCRLIQNITDVTLTLSSPVMSMLHCRVFRAILVEPAFLFFFDIRALWRSELSARVPECQKN